MPPSPMAQITYAVAGRAGSAVTASLSSVAPLSTSVTGGDQVAPPSTERFTSTFERVEAASTLNSRVARYAIPSAPIETHGSLRRTKASDGQLVVPGTSTRRQ